LLADLGQTDKGAVHAGEMGGPVIGQHDQHAQQQAADGQLPGRAPRSAAARSAALFLLEMAFMVAARLRAVAWPAQRRIERRQAP